MLLREAVVAPGLVVSSLGWMAMGHQGGGGEDEMGYYLRSLPAQAIL